MSDFIGKQTGLYQQGGAIPAHAIPQAPWDF